MVRLAPKRCKKEKLLAQGPAGLLNHLKLFLSAVKTFPNKAGLVSSLAHGTKKIQ